MTAPDVRTPGGNPANAEDQTNPAIIATRAQLEKDFLTFRAVAAQSAVQAYQLCGGAVLLVWRGCSRECATLAEAQDRIARMSGKDTQCPPA